MVTIEVNAKALVFFITSMLFLTNGIMGYMAINDEADCWKYGIIACIQAICMFVVDLMIKAWWVI
jgi:hypothetical protein